MLALVLFFGFVLSFEAALFLTPAVRRLALERGFVDQPDGDRKIHSEPVPAIGGVAIVGATLFGLMCFLLAQPWLPEPLPSLGPPPLIVLGAVLIAGVGIIDDRRDLNFKSRLLAQVLVSLLVVASGYKIDVLDRVLGDGTVGLIVSVLLTVVWMVGTMNAVNFIDGMDGLAAGSVGIAIIGISGVHIVSGNVSGMILAVALVGALLGFLRYNSHPATIFMGDGGSLFLGYLLASFALRGGAHPHPVLQFVIPVVAMGLPILDTGVSIIRRLATGHPPFYPDRNHIHHRLAGIASYRRTILLLYVLSGFFAVGAIAMALVAPIPAFVIFALGCACTAWFLFRLGYFSGDAPDEPPRKGLATRIWLPPRVDGARRSPSESSETADSASHVVV